MKTVEYLDAVKLRLGAQSDYRIAKILGVTPQTISGWRSGFRSPDSLMAFRIAEILHMNPARVTSDIEIERAEKAGKPEQVGAWREVLERLGGLAAAVLVGTVLTAPPPANAHQTVETSGNALYIM